VLSFSFSTKEQKNRDPLEPVRTRLEPLDIKAIIPYVIGKTTHVVATKRNTAKGLQALINAKYIVTDSFLDAVVLAATPEPPDDPEGLSPLEVDFDKNWPDALCHLPAQSKEPSQRPSTFFAPDPRRANVFEGYTFIFCDNTQYENLHSPIANGGGKALLFELCMGETTAEELLQYVKNVAGDKGSGELDDRGDEKGVVVVRFRGKKGMEKWSIELGNEVARKLDQRLIEQSEFLDAILVNDASGLRKTLPEEEHDDGEDDELPELPTPAGKASFDRNQPLSVANVAQETSMLGNERTHEHTEVALQSAPEPPQIPQQLGKRTRPRFVTSRFKGFDDGFNPVSLQQPSRVLSSTQIENSPERHERTNDEPVCASVFFLKVFPDDYRDQNCLENLARRKIFSLSMRPRRRRLSEGSGVPRHQRTKITTKS
jgi:Second BRCT domain on Nijmegen syndrome breakage protein